MATKKCLLCGEDKSMANYIAVRSKLLNGVMPICRRCVGSQIVNKTETERWNQVNKLCQLADVPFVPEEFEKIFAVHGGEAFGPYCYMFREKPYDTIDWTEYNEAYLQLQDEERLDNATPELKAYKLQQLQNKWGNQYDYEQISYLENLHQGIINTAGVVGALNEDQVLKICKISLLIEEKMRAGLDISKDLKSYDDLCKLAGVTSQSVKEGSEFGSTGELWAYLEKLGYKANYYDGAVNDEVDKTMKDIGYWLRYLYINETNVGTEIEERINNLKTADKLTGEDFDWGEYQKYVDDLDENEEFKIEI